MFFDHKADSLPLLLSSVQVGNGAATATETQTETATQLQRQPLQPFVVGVDLGGTQTRAALIRGDEIVVRTSRPTPAHDGPAAVIAGIVAAIHEALEMSEIALQDIRGIGLGAPGPTNSRTGVVYDTPNMAGWKDVPLRDELAKAFPSLPVYVGHDASVAALAEFRYGAGRNVRDMIYMTVSTGIGGGIIAGDVIVEGAIGTAGEIGHVIIDLRPDAPRCGSGHIGCIEALASGTALARDANALVASGHGQGILIVHRELIAQEEHGERRTTEVDAIQGEQLRARDVVEAAHRGDPEASELLHTAAVDIGITCVNLIHTLNPEMIVFGGGVAHAAGDLLFTPVRETLRARAFMRPAEAVQIVPTQLGNDVGLIGAAAFVEYQQHSESSQRGPTTA
ncbi:MAG TPA: ROK family protein [Ktedonobacterales bacterium]|nr:ROK family protein [Ktedonobacterales bacterium]